MPHCPPPQPAKLGAADWALAPEPPLATAKVESWRSTCWAPQAGQTVSATFPAAILARWFGAHSPALEVEFRSAIFQSQSAIRPENLREFGEQFAAQHELQLPPDVDPDGRLAAAVQRDFDLGRQIGLEYVPLVFVIGRGGDALQWVEVTELEKLPAAIAEMRKATKR